MIWILGAAAAFIAGTFGLTHFAAWYAKRKLPPRGEFVELPSCRIHFVEKGEGETVLLIHGLAGSLLNFAYALIERLAGKYHVVAVDRPGSGYSTRARDEDASLPNQARLIAEFMRARKMGRVFVVGHSLGGAVTLQLALDHPELVRGLALISPLTQFQADVPAVFNHLKVRSPRFRRIYGKAFLVPRMILMGRRVVSAIFHPNIPPKDFAVKGGGLLGARPESYYNAATDLIALETHLEPLAARYSELKIPVGILHGREDQVLSYERHGKPLENFAPNFSVTAVSGGHMLVVTDVEASCALIEATEARSRGQELT